MHDLPLHAENRPKPCLTREITPIMLFHTFVGALLLSSPLLAQSAGFKDFNLPNSTGAGSLNIPVRVHYPATSTGQDTPLILQAGGYPVVVFVHGGGLSGNDYSLLGDHLATEGYVVVLPNSVMQLRADSNALSQVLATINSSSGHFLEGALDMGRAGIAGHSLGGVDTVQVLAINTTYKAGFCFAPANPGGVTNQVRVPLGVIHGRGDAISNWRTNGRGMFEAATSYTGLKFLYLLNSNADHFNLVGLGTTSFDLQFWLRSARVMTGYFDCYLKGETSGLGEVAGLDGRSAPRLSSLLLEVEQPELWVVGTPAMGQTIRLELIAEAGRAGVLTAASTGSSNTQFGELKLDPATLRLVLNGAVGPSIYISWDVLVPGTLSVGDVVPIQGYGLQSQGMYRLTGLTEVVIQ